MIKLLFLILFLNISVQAAVFPDLKISSTSASKIASTSIFEILSTNKGILFPRMTSAQRTAISSPADTLMVFDTDLDAVAVYIASTSTWSFIPSGAPNTVGTFDSQTANQTGATIANNTFYQQAATALVPGLVSSTTQTFAGNKTFTGNISTSGVYQSAGSTFISNPGTSNTFLGIGAGTGASSSFNTAIGSSACDTTISGGLNTCIGVNALGNMTSGTQNTAIGVNTCSTVTTQSNNVCLGYSSDVGAGFSNSLAMGANSTANRSNSIILGGSAINVGIGAVDSGVPTARLHIPAGTSSAATAPLKIASGTNLTAPEAGAIENDGSFLYYTSSSATRSKIMTNPLTTKGDLLVQSTSVTRLPVGTSGYVLTADSGETSGIKWASTTSGAAVLELGYVVWPGVTNCQWASTSNATWGNVGVDSDCTLPAGGNIVGTSLGAPSDKDPSVVITSADTGASTYYYITVIGNLNVLNGAGSACSFRMTDGVDVSTTVPIWGSDGVADDGQNGVAVFIIHLSTSGTRTLHLQMTGVSTNNTCQIKNSTATYENLTFSVRKATVN